MGTWFARLAIIAAAVVCVARPAAAQSQAQITLYRQDGNRGPSLQLILAAPNLAQYGFAKRTVSFVVNSGRWQLCDHAEFAGKCIVVPAGKYPASYDNGFALTVVSVRPAPAHT
jgi:hypothetical protein